MFPDRLAKLRTERKKTHQDMADMLGITRQAYSHYENGKREPDYSTLGRLASYFEVSIDYLLGKSNVRSFEEVEVDVDPSINVAYLGGVKHELTPDVARRLKEDIELFKKLEEQFLRDKEREKGK